MPGAAGGGLPGVPLGMLGGASGGRRGLGGPSGRGRALSWFPAAGRQQGPVSPGMRVCPGVGRAAPLTEHPRSHGAPCRVVPAPAGVWGGGRVTGPGGLGQLSPEVAVLRFCVTPELVVPCCYSAVLLNHKTSVFPIARVMDALQVWRLSHTRFITEWQHSAWEVLRHWMSCSQIPFFCVKRKYWVMSCYELF